MPILAGTKFAVRLTIIALVILSVVTKSTQIPSFISWSGSYSSLEIPVSQSHKISNPAAVYCRDLGYTYRVVSNEAGGQTDACDMPDGHVCNAWDFLKGKCGQDYSYCATLGLRTRTAVDGKNPFSPEYAICVDGRGDDVGSVTTLDHLGARVNRCGANTELPAMSSVIPDGQLDPQVSPGRSLTSTPPSSWDWRYATYAGITGDWTTPVKNQGACGSCWAFAAVGQTEAVLNMAAANPDLDKDLSEEYLVSDCSPLGSCCGGWHPGALDFIEDHGIPDESCLPYVSGACGCDGGACTCSYVGADVCSNAACSQRCSDYQSRLYRIDSFDHVGDEHNSPSVQQARIKEAMIAYGPLSAAMDVAEGDNYWIGDVFMCSHPQDVDHAVLLVGFNDAGGYWIAKNSWGSGFQENGFFKVGYGQCFIERYVYHAYAASSNGNGRFFLPLVIQPR